MRTELFHANGGADRLTSITKLIVAFRSGANMPRNGSAFVCYTSPIIRQLQKNSAKVGFYVQKV